MSDKRFTPWTRRELKVLDLYEPFYFTREMIAERTGRSLRAVKDKLARDARHKLPRKAWTKDEDEKLLKMAKRKWWPAAAYTDAFPSRTYYAIKAQLARLRTKHERTLT